MYETFGLSVVLVDTNTHGIYVCNIPGPHFSIYFNAGLPQKLRGVEVRQLHYVEAFARGNEEIRHG